MGVIHFDLVDPLTDCAVMQTTAVKVLVADSGAFIKAPLEKWSSSVVTVKEVVAEVRDENTRRRLQVLPYELHLQEPTQEALHHGRLLLINDVPT